MVGIAACGDANKLILAPGAPTGGAMFKNYVAIGNSITAGYQSGGINDSVQRASYANLFAIQVGTRFAYPSFTKSFALPTGLVITSGCGPMTGNWLTQKKTDSLFATPGGCSLRDPTKATDILNNVAVPGAYAADLTVTGLGVIVPNNGLNTLILGGKSQVNRALDADPTFISFWIGNNETLLPAEAGMLGGPATGSPAPPLIPSTSEIPAMAKAINALVAGSPHLKGGIIIGAAFVTGVPHFFSADTIGLSASRLAEFATFTGKGTPAVIGCGTAVNGWLISADLAIQIKAGTHPNVVSCFANTPAAPIGDIFMLDPTEQAALIATTTAYNAYLKAKADSLGWAYLDPNVTLAALRTGTPALVAGWPSLKSNTRDATTSVFGSIFSLDGVHPTAAGQKLIANAMIDAVNAKYGTTIGHVP
jgi:lysophospholipase L1-like esterase